MKNRVSQPTAAGKLTNRRSPRAHGVVRIAIPLIVGLAILAFAVAPAFASAPAVEGQSVEFVMPFEARVIAKVNGGGESTECHVQYGVGSVSEHEVPCEQGATLPKDFTQYVNVTMIELTPGMPYHYRFVVKNAAGKSEGMSEEFATLTLEKPGVESEGASVKATAATLKARVNPDYQKTTYIFEYATTKALTEVKTVSGATELKGGAGQLASVALSGLEEGGTYYYRVIAENETSKKEGKSVEGPVQSFTTVAAPHTDLVTAIGATTATFNGHLTLNPLNTTVATQFSFDYNPSATECVNYLQSASGEAGTGSGLVKEKTEVTELQPNATYSVCFVTSNAFGSEVDSALPLVQFKTEPAPPKVDSESVSAVTPAEATLEAQVNPNNQETHAYTQYSTSATVIGSGPTKGALEAAKSTETPPGAEVGSNFEDHPTTPGALTGLTAGTTYYYQAVTTNATGTTYGTVQSFTTQGAPLVSTGEALETTQSTAELAGTITPVGLESSYQFEYVSETGYQAALAEGASDPYHTGSITYPVISIGSTSTTGAGPGYEPLALSPLKVEGLQAGTTYHYALIARNAFGTTVGHDVTFTTLPASASRPPTVNTGAVSGVSQNSATLSGTVSTNSLQTEYGFEISTEPGNYGPATGLGGIGGAQTETVTLTLGELQPGTTYYYRVTATNADGTVQGAPETFATPGFPTLVTTPTAPPLVAYTSPGFPTGSLANTGTGAEVKTLTNAEKLSKALKACHAKKGKKRSSCEAAAHKRYAPASKKKGATKKK